MTNMKILKNIEIIKFITTALNIAIQKKVYRKLINFTIKISVVISILLTTNQDAALISYSPNLVAVLVSVFFR